MGFTADIGIDLGTANVLVCVNDKIVLDEPSVVAIKNEDKRILAIGEDARRMLGRTPEGISAVRPLRDGVISDYDITERMLKHLLSKTCTNNRFFRPRIMISVPGGATDVERRAVSEAAFQAGGRAVYVIEEPLAAAMGSGLDIVSADGVMIVDIGGGTTDIAAVSLGGIVSGLTLKVAGDKFDDAIIKYIRKAKNIILGERTAERIKIEIGCAYPNCKNEEGLYKGRDMSTGLPATVRITSEDVYNALSPSLVAICDGIHEVLESASPEIVGDIASNGIMVTGGGALLPGIDSLISEMTGIPAFIADEPRNSVAAGTAIALSRLGTFEGSLMKSSKRFM